MSDKIKRAARERQARTGEPYTPARRMVIEERERSRAAVESGTGLVSLDPPPPVTHDGPMRDADAGTPEPFFAFTDEHGEFLSRLFGPLNPEPSSGPPHAHVHRLPETEEEMTAAPVLPALTVERGLDGGL